MKIAINNLGPIKRFEFDLSKDINVLFGKNNVGKSYAITAVYLLIKNLLNQNFRNSTEFDYFVFRNHIRNRFEYAPKIFKEIDEIESMIISKLKDNDPLNITKEIKKVLAYSTVSQLGLLFAALGVGAFSSAFFHLTTHAFFKALLFLGAGSVI